MRNTIEANELHIISKLLNVSPSARCENALNEVFKTDTGAPQGDCASTHEFTYYLTKALDPVKFNQPLDHSYVEQTISSKIAHHLTEQSYYMVTQKYQINIDMQYANDINKPTSNHSSIQIFKHHMPEVLESRDLMINKDKTEQYLINRTTNEW